MSWQDDLMSLRSSLPEGDDTPAADSAPAPEPARKGCVHIVTERKGRHGKTSTIITGFDLDDAALAEVAAELKKSLATGGSARGGEILVQGERRDDVRRWLQARGYTVKG